MELEHCIVCGEEIPYLEGFYAFDGFLCLKCFEERYKP
jgi:recombinational DNA repair protein (RecF pathway)